MRAFLAMAALCLALAPAPADARPHHRHHRYHRVQGIGQPAQCAGMAWCGCWLRLRYGLSDTRLNLARTWYGVGSPALFCRPGLIAVWPHHVGEVTGCPGGGMIQMISGNDGNAVRDRVRPLGRGQLRAL